MTAIKNSRGKVTHYVIVFRDITASKQSEEKIIYQATHDALTGLPNRQLFNDRLKKSLAHARRYQQKLAVMFLDLDNFKNINDSLGHQIGDLFLKEVAKRLKNSCRDSDTVARQGGDEFTLILPDIKKGDHNAVKMAQRIFTAFAAPIVLKGDELFARASIGITLYPNDGDDCATLLKNADMAMYKAKKKGKNTYTLFEQNINDAVVRRIELESGLRKALEGGEFRIHYQPKVEIRTGFISGAEALVRWQRAGGELIPPNEFISLAEDIGVIYPLGEWVLQTACRQTKAWHEAGFNFLTIAVNLSAKQYQDENLIRLVQEILLETDLAPEFLNLEVTENIVMRDVEAAISIMQQLSKMGIRISIDDFGTGYSSLNYLKKFPLDVLKIDRSFVQDIPDDADDVAIAKAILSLGQSLKLKVVAEGVETNEQLKFMQAHGCDEIQGYLFSKPLPTRKFTSLLKQNRKFQAE